MQIAIRIIQIILTASMIYGAYDLFAATLDGQDVCPEVFGVSTCYILMGCLVAMMLSYISRILHPLFSLGLSVGFCLLASAAYYQSKGMFECPKVLDDISMCYVGLGIFVVLFILDIIDSRLARKRR